MPKNKIASVGYEYSSIEKINYFDNQSFTDYDVLIIDPQFMLRIQNLEHLHTSKYRLTKEEQVYKLINKFKDRKKEIEIILNSGKLIITFLIPPYDIRYFIPGTNIEGNIKDYEWLGLRSGISFSYLVEAKGKEIKLFKNNHLANPFYRTMKNEINYSAFLSLTPENYQQYCDTFLTNKTDQIIGFSLNERKGLIIFLPEFDHNDKNDEKFVGVVSQIAKEYFGKAIPTEPPNWLDEFQIPGTEELKERVESIQLEIKTLEDSKEQIEVKIHNKQKLRMLLYETGFLLQESVIEAFKLMGFNAQTIGLKNTDLDVVLGSEEGRIIAEVEGRENEAIHKSKIDQLLSAINQDADESGSFAEGLLIGNPYRLMKPQEREYPFTPAVINLAKLRNFSLLTTEELYYAVIYILKNPGDLDFQKACREEIFESRGRLIKFPIERNK